MYHINIATISRFNMRCSRRILYVVHIARLAHLDYVVYEDRPTKFHSWVIHHHSAKSQTTGDQITGNDTFLRLFGKVPCGRLLDHFERQREKDREKGRKRESTFLVSIYRCDYLAPLTSARPDQSTRIARSPMNGACNLACGSPSAAAGTGEVNSWPTSESLLHSRRCELPFEISIFYAYTWEICRRPARRYRRATQFRLMQRRRKYMYVHLYVCTRECTQSRLTFAEGQKRELFLFLSTQLSATTSLTPVESLSRADIIVPWSGESRSLCAMPVHAFGKWPPILSRDSSPSKWSPLEAQLRLRSCSLVALPQ